MGPSGSGKSTLLAVLMGTATYGTFTGQVWINGRLMKVSRLRRIMGYVPQVGPLNGSSRHGVLHSHSPAAVHKRLPVSVLVYSECTAAAGAGVKGA